MTSLGGVIPGHHLTIHTIDLPLVSRAPRVFPLTVNNTPQSTANVVIVLLRGQSIVINQRDEYLSALPV